MGQYRIEVSPNARATCKNKDCKDNAVKITKGEARFGTFIEVGGNQSWSYKHWGCVTPAQIQNIKDSIEGDFDLFDGYDEVDEEMQEKIRRALDQGHVDDADWKGDIEMNRPGMRGMHKRTPKKKKAEQNTDEDGIEAAEEKPAKKAFRKRGRSAEDDGEVEESKPEAKKAKSKSKSKPKSKSTAQDDEGEESDVPIRKKESSRAKKTGSPAEEKPKAKSRAGKKNEDAANGTKQEKATSRKPRAQKSKPALDPAADEAAEAQDEDAADELKKSPPSRKSKKTKKTEATHHEATDENVSRPRRAKRGAK